MELNISFKHMAGSRRSRSLLCFVSSPEWQLEAPTFLETINWFRHVVCLWRQSEQPGQQRILSTGSATIAACGQADSSAAKISRPPTADLTLRGIPRGAHGDRFWLAFIGSFQVEYFEEKKMDNNNRVLNIACIKNESVKIEEYCYERIFWLIDLYKTNSHENWTRNLLVSSPSTNTLSSFSWRTWNFVTGSWKQKDIYGSHSNTT